MKLRYLNYMACMASLLCLCLHPSSAEAIFASVKSTGMAATCISYPLDSLAGAYNPAGNADVGDRFDLEGAWVQDWGHARVRGNAIPIVNGYFDGMRTKYVFPVGFGYNKSWCCRNDVNISTGFILYNRNYQKTTYKTFLPLLGTSRAGLEYLNQTLSSIFAISWCGQSIGISANYQIERVKVNGVQNFDHPPGIPGVPGGSLYPGHVTNRGYNYARGWGVTIGYLGHITDALSVGVTYQPETRMSRLDKYKGFLSNKGRLNIPRKIGAGVSYRILPCLIVAFDVEHIQWSKIRALHNPLLHNGTLTPLGAKNGPGFGFRNQWYYRVGAEWEVNDCLALRIGFRHANTPVRRTQTAVNVLTLDTVQDFLTVGATWNFNPRNEFSMFYAYGFPHKVRGKNSIPVFLGAGNIDLKEQKFALGLAWGYKF